MGKRGKERYQERKMDSRKGRRMKKHNGEEKKKKRRR